MRGYRQPQAAGILLLCCAGHAQVWDVRTHKCVKTLEGHEDNVRVLAVGETCMFSGSWDKTIRVWDLRTLECIKVLEGHTEAVLALAGGWGGGRSGLSRGSTGCTLQGRAGTGRGAPAVVDKHRLQIIVTKLVFTCRDTCMWPPALFSRGELAGYTDRLVWIVCCWFNARSG